MSEVATGQAVVEMEITAVPVAMLDRSRYQRRKNFAAEAEKEMAESVREHGVILPLIVRPGEAGRFELVAGERRWRAAKRVGLLTVPAIVREDLSEKEAAELCLLENLQRVDLGPLEEAESLQDLRELGMEIKEICERIGKSRKYVEKRLTLLKLGAPGREAVDKGLSLNAAQRLARLPEETQKEATKELMRRGVHQGAFGERDALDLLQRQYLEPLRMQGVYDGHRSFVLQGLADGGLEPEWGGYEEAQAWGSWHSGMRPAEERPRGPELSTAARERLAEDPGQIPTWGELAERNGLRGRVAVAREPWHWEDGEEPATRFAGQIFLKPFRYWVVIDPEPIKEGEKRRDKEEGELGLFGRGGAESEEDREARAREQAESRERAGTLRREVKALVTELLEGELPASKERQVAIEAWKVWRDCGVGPEWMELEELLGWDEEEAEKAERKRLARFRKGDGGLNYLGALSGAAFLAEMLPQRSETLALLYRCGLFPKSKYPQLHELGAELEGEGEE